MLACEQDVSSFPRKKQQHGHGQRDSGLDSWEKLQDPLNALRELRRWVPKDGWKESEPQRCVGLNSSALQNIGELGLSLKQFCSILNVNSISLIQSFV